MYEQGFFTEPYTMSIKTTWTETDIITYDDLNSMIVDNINLLKSYSRSDLTWYPISSIVNMDYRLANWIELDIDALATQEPLPEDTYTLTVNNGTGSGVYEAGTVVTIYANTPDTGLAFDYWSGDHLENIESATASITTYTMPYEDVTLTANYTGTDVHTLTVVTNSGTTTTSLLMGRTASIEADPAPYGTVFNNWNVSPSDYEENLYEPAATTTFTMPNEDVTLTAVYVTVGQKHLVINYGTGSGYYDYGTTVSIAPTVPDGYEFTTWSGNTQYQNSSATQAYNTVTIPDVTTITLTANFQRLPATDLTVTVVNGVITDTGETTGVYDEGDTVSVTADDPEDGYGFSSWSISTTSGSGTTISGSSLTTATITVGRYDLTAKATYKKLDVPLTVVNGTITSTGETEGTFDEGTGVSLTADDAPDGYVFRIWSYTGGGGWAITASGSVVNYTNPVNFYMGSTEAEVTANYRELVYSTLTVITYSGTTTYTKEAYDSFSINASPAPDGYTFDYWDGDTSGLKDVESSSTSCSYMGSSDRTITAVYREITSHTLTVTQMSGYETYEQDEFTTVEITAEDAPDGMVFNGWSLSGEGSLSSSSSQTTTFTFGNGDATLTPKYVNVWTITVENGTIGNSYTSATLKEGYSYTLKCKSLAVYEMFEGWTLDGEGSIANTASTETTFTVGEGDATITANISQYPDVTLTVYFQDPDTEELTLISQTSYTYGTEIDSIEAPVAPDKTTFLTWLGDVDYISPSALASTVKITSLTTDVTITATYYYPESPEYYTLTITNGTPASGSYAAGTQVAIYANDPADGWEFYRWQGDTAYLVDPDTSLSENSVIIPKQAISLTAKYKVEGDLALYRVTVSGGTASATYTDSSGNEQSVSDVYIDVPAGTVVTLTADADVVGYRFSYWSGNFSTAGVTDLTATANPATFTMPEADINVTMIREEIGKATVYTTNATAIGEVYPGTYTIAGNLQNTDDYHYTFVKWTCVDANGNDCSSVIADTTSIETEITLEEDDVFWVEAVYTTYYHLVVVNGQDTGSGYYYEGEVVNSITADDAPDEQSQFDYWDDPVGIIENIYDPTPTITMSDTVATITAVYVAIDSQGNSVAVTGDDLSEGVIERSNSYLINGVFAIGTIVFDKDGCIGVVTEIDPDSNDDTTDYGVEKLFYGGNS